ncbi:hypothetical protein HU200_034668 [Digitaria exilis]|uniref:GRF-type domain-containing protein n=1 Tax=Digitaria exilis TaxID=1010633 RepID=A0A835ENM1_9POAL|nr:hypothetical protein HU200_034668 [Digitaria exilis]
MSRWGESQSSSRSRPGTWSRVRPLTNVNGVGEETGLPLITCPECGRVRVIELRVKTNENGNEGRVFFKCPRRAAQMGSRRCEYFSWQREYLFTLVFKKVIKIDDTVDGEPSGAPGTENASREIFDSVSGRVESNGMEAKIDSFIRAIKMLVVVLLVGVVVGIMFQFK